MTFVMCFAILFSFDVQAKDATKKAAAKTAQASSVDSDKPILDYGNLDKYSGDEFYEYHKALGQLMAEIERFQSLDASAKGKTAFLIKLIEESFAGSEGMPPYRVGQDCLIGGGYWGQFETRSNGGLTCNSPQQCTPSGGGQGHQCNPLFFTHNTNGSPLCVRMERTLTTTGCLPAFDSLYQRLCPNGGNEPCQAFADHFRASVRRETGRDDARTIRGYVDRIFSQYERIKDYCFNSDGSVKNHDLGQKESCFKLREYYERVLSIYRQLRAPNFACIESGVSSTMSTPHGNSRAIAMQTPSAQIGLLALRSKELADTKWPMRWFGARTRGEAAIRSTIHSLVAVGVCENKPMTSSHKASLDSLLNQDKLGAQAPATYANLFGGASPLVIRDQGLQNYNQSTRLNNWNSAAGENLKSCQKREMTAQEKRALCHKLHRSCGLNTSSCNEEPDRDGGGNDGGTNGSTTGGTTGSTSGSTNGSTSGGSEVGEGSNNAEGDQGGGHGSGPGG